MKTNRTAKEDIAAGKRIAEKWVGKKKLSKTEIQKDEFLSAVAKFADTAVKYGRDVYGAEHTPLFVTYLDRELLKSPAKIPHMRVDQGCSPTPTIDMNFDYSQNLFRGLVAMSQCTGDPKYAEAVMEAVLYIKENLYTPETGLFPMGAHTGFDLITMRPYCDSRPYTCIELNGVYPFYEFYHDVDPEFTSTLVKGIWEAFLIDWHGMTYNRHAPVTKTPDFDNTWKRPCTKLENLPTTIEGGYAGNLGMISAAYDLAFSGYTIGLLENEPDARKWALRMLEVINYFRDPKTKIWPMELYSPYMRRKLNTCYGVDYPESNPTEPRVIISSGILGMPSKFFGPLGVVEQAEKSGTKEEMAGIHQKIDENILGYMSAAYDREKGMRSIILDGTDVTDYVFTPDRCLHGWGARPGHSFTHMKPPPGFHAAIARAWRLTPSDAARKEYWGILRDLFRGDGLGDIGEDGNAQPALDVKTTSAQQAYVFALSDIYRVNKNPQVLKMMERIGRNIIAGRQDAESGLFVVETDRAWSIAEPIKGVKLRFTTVRESMRAEFAGIVLDYDRPKVVRLDVSEPLALLTIHACRTGQFDKIPMVLNPGEAEGMINYQLEIWYDREKMKKYYAANAERLREQEHSITQEWYPSRD